MHRCETDWDLGWLLRLFYIPSKPLLRGLLALTCALLPPLLPYFAQEEQARVASPDASPFENVPDAVSKEGTDQAFSREVSFTGKPAKLGKLTVQDSMKLLSSKSMKLKRMGSVSRKDSLMAVGSGAVSVADIHHLEDESDIQVAAATIHE